MLKQRIRALERKFAHELAEIAADKAATEYVDEWEQAEQENQPVPDPFEFCYKLLRTVGYFQSTTGRVQVYLEECLIDRVVPDLSRLFRMLVPDCVYS